MLGDFRIDQFVADRLEPPEGAALVSSDQSGVARYVSSKDCSEAAGLAHIASPATRRRPDSNNSRSSGLRKGISLGTTTGVMARSFATMAYASSSRPIWA